MEGMEHGHGTGKRLTETELIVRVAILNYWLSLLLKQRWKIRSNGLTVRQDYGSICFGCRAFP